ncbi:hypothetical protein NHH03_13200 [Stieleria sp. TO1_6]|uniref:hypothetical protein n=1 Tax=Stieleria tagensis TaxID=2956795 RepID=UPI00209B66AE|nr:hypothetical protein [Stieleria tagensis]MCO8122698.1 hypothetical protein [Stieleria tagensis]
MPGKPAMLGWTKCRGGRWNRPARLVMLLAVLGFVGCADSKTSETASTSPDGAQSQKGLPAVSAADFLRQVLRRYQNASHYRDQGEVRLRIEQDGQLLRQTAPMQVALEGTTIWIAAYDARLWSDDQQTLGWLADQRTRYHDAQVVVGPVSTGRPTLSLLLQDPILSERMVAGLGGPPPQLEWLFDPDPMAKLFTDAAADAIEYQGIDESDGVKCVVVHAVVDRDRYRFWIDPDQSVIRNVDLPVSMAGQAVQLEGAKVHSLELSLVGATFDPPQEPFELPQMQHFDFPPQPKYLRALVPLPPPRPNPRLGSRVPGQKRTDRGVTLMVACHRQTTADAEPQNIHAVQSLAAWLAHSPEEVRSRVQPVALVDQAAQRILDQSSVASIGWALLRDDAGRTQQRIGIDAGQAAAMDASGRLVWVGDPRSPLDISVLGTVVIDTLAGIDVPQRMREQWQSDRSAYQAKLKTLAVPTP